jgi:hypothetical protein
MKKNIFITLILSLAIQMYCDAQLVKDLKKMVKPSSSGNLTEEEAASGIREALIKGTTTGVETVSKLDGYFKNPEIKIPFPPEASEIEQKLRAVGLGNKVDEVVLSINRAA